MLSTILKSVLLLVSIQTAACTVCYHCDNVGDGQICSTNTTCADGQSCYKSVTEVNGSPVSTLGCMDNQQCSGHAHAIIGRRQLSSCHECCSTDLCNMNLCFHPKPSACVDDELLDCARLNSIFSVCSDIDHAKATCPKFCGLCNVVDGGWSDWTAWSVCDVSCNNGTQVRARTCTSPRPEHGGIDCVGQTKDTKPCYRASVCPVHGGWSTWNPWEACSQTCDIGIQRRTRDCSNPKPAYSGDHCFGINADSRLCNLGACADGGWSSWTSWSTCSSTSGVGIRSQSRSCTNPAPSHDGRYCVGDTIKVDTCKPKVYPADCSDVKQQNASATDGIYTITLWKSKRNIQVYCDMTTDGGGWTVFQYRYDGSVDFYRNYSEYVHGFGNLNTEFWLGLDYVEEMVAQLLTDLRVDLMDGSGTTAYEVISPFSLSMPNYVIHLGNTTSSHNMNYSQYPFAAYHNGNAFSTQDHDVDLSSGNCALARHGAWWFNHCFYAHLNGEYLPPGPVARGRGIEYLSFRFDVSLKQSKMSFRRHGNI